MPDHQLTYGHSIETGKLEPGDRVALVLVVEVRSDKRQLDADDLETHRYGGKVTSAGYVTQDQPVFELLATQARTLDDAAHGRQALPLDDGGDDGWETPARYVEGTDSVAMAPVELGGARTDVKLADLQAVELTPSRFYAAAFALKEGGTVADVTRGWTTAQVAYLDSFITKPKPKRARRDKPTPTDP